MRKFRGSFIYFLPQIMILTGCAAFALAVGGDLLGFGGQSGLGVRQAILALAGLLLAAAGAFLALPPGRRWAAEIHDPSAPSRRPTSILLTAVWFGLVAGLGEAAVLSARKLLENRVINLSHHFPWMIPLGEAALFLLPGLLLLLFSRRWPRLTAPRTPVFIFSFLAVLSWLFLFPRLHLYACLLLAAGLALQASRLAAAHPGTFFWLVRRTTPALAALVGLLLASIYTWGALGERRVQASQPPAPAGAANILVVVLDTVRAQNLSLYGYPRPTTPNLERLASQGATFQQAFATAPWTLPSHGSLFTGRWHHEQSAELDQAFDSAFPTLAEVLTERGYATAGFVANTYYGSYEHGLQRGFTHYEDYTVSPGQIFLSGSLVRKLIQDILKERLPQHRLFLPKTAEAVNEAFFRWLPHREARPFFAFLNYMDAHGPYLPPAPFDEMYGPQNRRANPNQIPPWEWTSEQVQAEIDAYDGAIAYLDEQVGGLYAGLQERGLLENTLLVIVSDHGEHLGERDLFDHANSLYVQVLQVPLVILFPGQAHAGQWVTEPVSLRELPATIFDQVLGAPQNTFPGQSLARYWSSPGASTEARQELILSEMNWTPLSAREFPEWYPITRGDMKSLVTYPFHYISNGDGSQELYDLRTDPDERLDLSQVEEIRQTLEGFKTTLQGILPRAGR